MAKSALDRMIEQCVERIASADDIRIRALVRELAVLWPNEPALSISFALTSSAARIEDTFGGATRRADLAYRLAALLAADCFAIEAFNKRPARCEDLLHFWRRVDPYFLRI